MKTPEEFISVARPPGYVPRAVYWPAYTWPVQTSYLKVIPGKRAKILRDITSLNEDELKSRIATIFDKLNSTFYHLQRLKEVENVAIAQAQELAKVGMPDMEGLPGIVGMPYEPIGYEYESLLASAKTTLDVLAALIAKCTNRNEDEIVGLVNNLAQGKKLPRTAERISTVLERSKNKQFIDGFKNSGGKKSKRNYAVHVGALPVGTINVPVNNPIAPTLRSKAYEPHLTVPDQMSQSRSTPDLQDFADDVFYSTADVVVQCLGVILKTRFKLGERCSKYEEDAIARTNRKVKLD